jgi:hypothetical protein
MTISSNTPNTTTYLRASAIDQDAGKSKADILKLGSPEGAGKRKRDQYLSETAVVMSNG